MNLQPCTKSSSHWLRTRNPETEMRLDIARTTIYGRVCRLISEEKRKKGGGRKKRGIVDNKSAEKRARSNGDEQETEEGGEGLGGGGPDCGDLSCRQADHQLQKSSLKLACPWATCNCSALCDEARSGGQVDTRVTCEHGHSQHAWRWGRVLDLKDLVQRSFNFAGCLAKENSTRCIAVKRQRFFKQSETSVSNKRIFLIKWRNTRQVQRSNFHLS